MGIKVFKPTTPGRRFMSKLTGEDITKKNPHKPLKTKLSKTGGRNNNGRVTSRHIGGGHKKSYRVIDFKRNKLNIPGIVETIEYDPNRNCRIGLIKYKDGERRYIIVPQGLTVGMEVISGENVPIQPGNAMPLKNIPEGTFIHNIELHPGKGGQIARGAGTGAKIMAKDGIYCHVMMPSSEVRLIHDKCFATIGQVGNEEFQNITWGKAGRIRYLGKKPHVRGVAMNPIDHPHGGGEGKSSGGRHPCTPWGKPTKGYKTRTKKPSDRYIIKRRKK
ncbi:MAG: 50S ribosomal protein L2 [bacterium]|nr:50S ribosomal protein L2 [bacterium]